MTTFPLALDRSGDVPLHRQIYDSFRRAILNGRLRPGQKLPSTRALASDLDVSRQPVLTAYEQLLHEGYLDGRHGSGTFVSAAIPDDLLQTRAPPGRSAAASTGQTPVESPPVAADGGRIGPFSIGEPALDEFPHRLWARLVARHARAATPADLAYSDPAGLLPLRAAVAEHLRAWRAVDCDGDQVLIVSGSQAALRLATAALLEHGDRVAMEEPGYPGARGAFLAGGVRPVPVPLDDEGIGLATLARLRRPLRAAYVTPSHQYPLGTTMSAARRLALLDWAEQKGAWLLEDDYDSEYRYVSRPLAALQGMDKHGRVIYIGTFSKVLFPAVRIGYLVVPRALRKQFVAARRVFDLCSPTLYQLALTEFLREGHFARHLRRMRAIYLGRRGALLTGLERHCNRYLTVFNADAGLHVAAELANGLDDRDLVRRMSACGLTATPLSSCYAGSARRSGLLLGFGGSTVPCLFDATRQLGELLREAAAKQATRRYPRSRGQVSRG
jgi:GntR family transcriptional regulator/MocR family aminotransferase